MPFNSRGKNLNTRSQHQPPGEPSSNPIGGGNEAAFEPKLDAPQQAGSPHDSQPKPRPPYHPQAQPLDSLYGAVNAQQGPGPSNTAPPGHNDFADHVARSQSLSQRYPTSLQTQYSTAASTSADDLGQTTSPSPSQLPSPPGYAQHLQQQHPPPEQKRSARKLIKGIFTGSGKSTSHSDQQGHYDNTGGLARRPSKRVSNPPGINIRSSYAQASQTSLDQEPGTDWPPPHNQQSPLPGVGEIDERYLRRDSNLGDLHFQNQNAPPPGALNPTIRPVQPAEDIAFHRDPPRHFPQGSGDFDLPPPPQQQQQFQQFASPASHTLLQGQGHYQPGPPGPPGPPLPQLHTSLLNPNPHNQNPETSSQVSRESPVTDSDPPSTHLQSTTTSPSATFGTQAQENPLPPLPPEAQQDRETQQSHGPMPPGGPTRRSQDTDNKSRAQDGPPGGTPPQYGRGSNTQVNPMAPPPPASGNQPAPALRAGGTSGQERLPYDGSQGVGDPQGRNSPQPSTLERDDPDKQFRELRKCMGHLILDIYLEARLTAICYSDKVQECETAVL